jgi:hypothetical protein
MFFPSLAKVVAGAFSRPVVEVVVVRGSLTPAGYLI